MTTTTWTKADLHIHTSHSDGRHDVSTILNHTADHTDIGILAITDHDCINGALEAKRLAPHYGLEVVVGQEVTTRRGHLLALFVRQLIPAGLSIRETVACVHAQGGLAVLAHPFDRVSNSPMRRWPRPTLADWRSFGLDGLEECNGAQLDPYAAHRASTLGKTLKIALTGGSDAHTKFAVGTNYTLFPGTSLAELRQALATGKCRAAGPGWTPIEYLRWLITLPPLRPSRTIHKAFNPVSSADIC